MKKNEKEGKEFGAKIIIKSKRKEKRRQRHAGQCDNDLHKSLTSKGGKRTIPEQELIGDDLFRAKEWRYQRGVKDSLLCLQC